MRNPSPSNTQLQRVVHGGGRTLALGSYGTGVLSEDGKTIREIVIPGMARDPNCMLWTGTRFVVAGPPGKVAVSTDGINWTSVSTGPEVQIRTMLWTGTGIVAMGDQGTWYLSPDGLEWTSPLIGPSFQYLVDSRGFLTWSGKEFFATAQEVVDLNVPPKNVIIHSKDGKDWTTVPQPADLDNDSVIIMAMEWIDSQLVVVTNAGGIHTTRDGKTWSLRKVRASGNSILASGPGAIFLVGSGGDGLFSKDGVEWKDTALVKPPDGFQDMVWADSQWIGVGADASFYVSRPGGTWKDLSSPRINDLHSVAWNGSSLLAAGLLGDVVASPDGAAWSAPLKLQTGFLNQVIWADNQWVAVARSGGIFTSPNGIDWAKRWSASSGPCSVVWTGRGFVAAGWNDNALISSDGMDWTMKPMGTKGVHYTRLAASDKMIVAVGEMGEVVTSPDGVDWTKRVPQSADFQQTLHTVVWTGSAFVAAGGEILTSPDGIEWTHRPQSLPTNINAMAWTGEKLVAVGSRRVLYSSTDGAQWTQESLSAPPDFSGLNDIVATPTTYVAVGNGGVILTAPLAPVAVRPPARVFPAMQGIKDPKARDALGRRLGGKGARRLPLLQFR